MFSGLERLRFSEKYNLRDKRPKKHRLLEDAAVIPIKNLVRTQIMALRLGTSEKEDDAAILAKNKKVKFLNFILNLHQKHAFRAWKERVFGTGGDPRLGLLLITERDRIREEFFKP